MMRGLMVDGNLNVIWENCAVCKKLTPHMLNYTIKEMQCSICVPKLKALQVMNDELDKLNERDNKLESQMKEKQKQYTWIFDCEYDDEFLKLRRERGEVIRQTSVKLKEWEALKHEIGRGI
jgi:hypothetical protein